MNRRFIVFCLSLILWVASARAEDLLVTVVGPKEALAPRAPWRVDLVAFNPTSTTAYLEPPATLSGVAGVDGRLIDVRFVLDEPGKMTLPSGGFGVRRYTAENPPPETGLIALEFRGGVVGVSRTALSVDALAESIPVKPSPLTSIASMNTTESAVERAFASRFGLHEPIYFIYGADDPVAKFQISFKYRLMQLSNQDGKHYEKTFQFAYTQRSLWDIDATSSPFYDTSYMPELMFQMVAPLPDNPDAWFSVLGAQAFFKHESNGRDGPNSRSMNTAGARGALVVGPLDQWHAIIAPELFAYVSSLEDNEDLKDYRGFTRFRVVLEKNNRRPALAYTFYAGKDFSHPTHQFDLTVPFRTRWLQIETSFLVQYFRGYGESLLDYKERSETVRFGLSLVR